MARTARPLRKLGGGRTMVASMGANAADPVLTPRMRWVLASCFVLATLAFPVNQATRCALVDPFRLLLVQGAVVPAGALFTFVVIASEERVFGRALVCSVLVGLVLVLGTGVGLFASAILSTVDVLPACRDGLNWR
jgi:hypothetical protein